HRREGRAEGVDRRSSARERRHAKSLQQVRLPAAARAGSEGDSPGADTLTAPCQHMQRSYVMEALGWALIAGGLALLVSGLIFLLLVQRRHPRQQQDIEQTIRETDDQLHEKRRELGDTS